MWNIVLLNNKVSIVDESYAVVKYDISYTEARALVMKHNRDL